MTISKKAIFAALAVALAPTVASAQNTLTFIPSQQLTPAQQSVQFFPNCGADSYQHLVGQSIHWNPAPAGARVIGPDTLVTLDYNPTRLNFRHQANGTILQVYCG